MCINCSTLNEAAQILCISGSSKCTWIKPIVCVCCILCWTNSVFLIQKETWNIREPLFSSLCTLNIRYDYNNREQYFLNMVRIFLFHRAKIILNGKWGWMKYMYNASKLKTLSLRTTSNRRSNSHSKVKPLNQIEIRSPVDIHSVLPVWVEKMQLFDQWPTRRYKIVFFLLNLMSENRVSDPLYSWS